MTRMVKSLVFFKRAGFFVLIILGGFLLMALVTFKENVENNSTIESKIKIHRGNVPRNHTTPLLTTALQCQRGISVVILVTSHAWTGLGRRATIRETWGIYRKDRAGIRNQKWQTFFVIGTSFDIREGHPYYENAYTALIRDEMAQHNDLIEGQFTETFNNLPFKLQIAFEWAHLYCSTPYIFKTDDDCFINTKLLFPYLNSIPNKDLYMGHYKHNDSPYREGKYKITYEEFGKEVYPDYIAGATMTFSSDVIARLVGIFNHGKYFRLEDVYIGMLIDKLRIKASKFNTTNILWDVTRSNEKDSECEWYATAIVRAFYFHGKDKRWCFYKMFNET